jgi:hypothetical protein
MDEIKLCKDCQWVKVGWIDKLLVGWRFAKCTHPDSEQEEEIDYSTGKIEPKHFYYCSTMRMGSCGKEANLFEPKS